MDFNQLKGRWKHSSPWDSDDYLTLYVISGSADQPVVTGKDLNDGEEFEISNVSWSDGTLEFISYMPSTRRKGINKFTSDGEGGIRTEFTFTVYEELVRENT